MIRLSGQMAASELLETLNQCDTYRVHSRFESGCNLVLPSSLCFIGNKNNALVPYGILLNEEDVPVFLAQVSPSRSFRWDGNRKVLYSDFAEICLKDTRIYSSFIEKKAYPIDREGLSIFERLIDRELPTGFGESIGSFLMTKEVEELYQAFKKPREEAEKIIKKWIGRGMGLTPSGDDFLMGLLFIDRIYPILGSPFLSGLKALTDHGYTTDISEHYYRCALGGRFHDAVVGLLNALVQKDSLLIGRYIDEIKRIGSTSGCDMICGMAAGVRFIKGKAKI
ncbi:MAG: DUF2877 domain-containing protein [Lacrimispora sp.]|uniref:DUF2877 domain-containing protein n=1 Tax=Lacrimispora sp. TaxID=2719234 RepID=UPI0039E4AC27